MRLLLMRHGAAVDPRVAGDDHRRWLTDDGRRCLRAQSERLLELGIKPDAILSSPLVRAVQTAEVMAHGCGCTGAVRVAPELHPSLGTTGDAVAALRLTAVETALAVGHEPLIRVLASHLAGVDLPAFRTGMICCVSWSGEGIGSSDWLMDPSRAEPMVYLG